MSRRPRVQKTGLPEALAQMKTTGVKPVAALAGQAKNEGSGTVAAGTRSRSLPASPLPLDVTFRLNLWVAGNDPKNSTCAGRAQEQTQLSRRVPALQHLELAQCRRARHGRTLRGIRVLGAA